MKIVFQSPSMLSEIAVEPIVVETARPGAIYFRPLSSPALYDDRIDVADRPATQRRVYPYKRADESVN